MLASRRAKDRRSGQRVSVASDSNPSGLAWPDTYVDLRPVVIEEWGVEGEIYLNRKLSGGKSGALVYTADLASRDFTGQAILKFDTVKGVDLSEEKEFERHRKAIETEPDYAGQHIERLVHASFQDNKVALISTIAGRGVEYVVPWSKCPFDTQLAIIKHLSADLLECWNAHYTLSAGLRSPQELLHAWLKHRIEKPTSRLFEFLPGQCGLAPDEPTFTFDGKWYPNPVAFAIGPDTAPDGARMRAVMGSSHGDLHGLNVLVLSKPSGDPTYSLIDLAMYEADQYLFYDHAYFEIAHLLATRDSSDPVYWTTILEHLREHHPTGLRHDIRADDLGLAQLIGALRGELYDWIDRHEANRLSYMESQYLLARVAAGLNFANKHLKAGHRRLAFLYAAFNLKLYLRHLGLDWSKHGPQLRSDAEPSAGVGAAPTSVIPPVADRSADRVAMPGKAEPPHLPEHPAIAVMPFENLGGGPEREHIADGISLEIITELSRVDWLTVIARGSSFAYKGKRIDPVEVGRELGVNYLVEGTVRTVGDQLRVTAELLDAADGRDIWTRRYDGTAEDVYAVLDEIAESVVANIDTELKRHQRQLAKRKRGSFTAWELVQRAMALFMRRTKLDSHAARDFLNRALEADPDSSQALAMLAIMDLRSLYLEPSEPADQVLDRALDLARRAVQSDEGSSIAHVALGRVYSLRGEHEKALVEGHEAVELNPSFSLGYLQLAGIQVCAGRAADGVQAVNKSMRLSPKDPFSRVRVFMLGICQYFLQDREAAEALFKRAQHGHFVAAIAYVFSAFIYARQDRWDEAHAALAGARNLRPDMSWDLLKANFGPMTPDYWAHVETDARKIGFLND